MMQQSACPKHDHPARAGTPAKTKARPALTHPASPFLQASSGNSTNESHLPAQLLGKHLIDAVVLRWHAACEGLCVLVLLTLVDVKRRQLRSKSAKAAQKDALVTWEDEGGALP